jgi:hypothetical protein
MTDHDAAHLILGHRPMHDEGEAQKYPWKIWSLEHKQAQEAEQCVWVLPTPYVYERTAKRGPKECHGKHRRYAEEQRGSKGKQPRKVCGRAAGGLFEKSRISLEEEDVVEEVEAERTKVKECGYKPPILSHRKLRLSNVVVKKPTWLLKNTVRTL